MKQRALSMYRRLGRQIDLGTMRGLSTRHALGWREMHAPRRPDAYPLVILALLTLALSLAASVAWLSLVYLVAR
jgi:hypothetical protein